jgi:hypothetical protein
MTLLHTPMIVVYEKYSDRLSGAYNVARIKSTRVEQNVNREPIAFVRDAMHVKSIRIERDIDQEPLAFCMQRYACKSYKDRMGHQSGAPCFFYTLVR